MTRAAGNAPPPPRPGASAPRPVRNSAPSEAFGRFVRTLARLECAVDARKPQGGAR